MKTIDLNKWNIYRNLIEEQLKDTIWVFRGQMESSWDLTTSIERLNFKDIQSLETELLTKFKRGLPCIPNTSSPLPTDDNDNLSFLALMQHHGAPTRLLDFTKSHIIAAFFAFESVPKFKVFDPEEKVAIWAINSTWLKRNALKKLLDNDIFVSDLSTDNKTICSSIVAKRNSLTDNFEEELTRIENNFYDSLDLGDRKYFNKVFVENRYKQAVIYPVEPEILSPRMHIQNGLFLCPSHFENSFMTILNAKDSDDSENILKITIPKSERENVLKDLYASRTNREALFQGIDGFTQSLLNSVYVKPW